MCIYLGTLSVSFDKRLEINIAGGCLNGKKKNPYPMSKEFQIWKWIFFAFLSFAIMEEMASEVHYLLLAMID